VLREKKLPARLVRSCVAADRELSTAGKDERERQVVGDVPSVMKACIAARPRSTAAGSSMKLELQHLAVRQNRVGAIPPDQFAEDALKQCNGVWSVHPVYASDAPSPPSSRRVRVGLADPEIDVLDPTRIVEPDPPAAPRVDEVDPLVRFLFVSSTERPFHVVLSRSTADELVCVRTCKCAIGSAPTAAPAKECAEERADEREKGVDGARDHLARTLSWSIAGRP
jgi:hypothetical protein